KLGATPINSERPHPPTSSPKIREKGSRKNFSKSLSQSWERDLGRGQNSQPTPPLLANHEIITLPSVTSLAVQREQWQQRQPAPNTLAVIADPVFKANDSRLGGNATNAIAGDLGQIDSLIRNSCGDFDRLPNTATEAEQILALVPDAQEFSATGFDANYAAATHPNLSQYRIVHLATHGCIQDNPLLSNLALSFFTADGQRAETSLLKLQDIYNLELNAELVVLSACQTGTGKDVRGEGVVGLTRGFMYAGARRVAVSLWSVNDRATSILMGDYYRQMLEGGIDPTAAMRQAQLAMWQSDSYSAPYYWAAFTMQGDW
ncbi:MAG: CHAT domain-containing protein, partial [Geitlerinemataceae cyanobacterium]